MENMSEDQSLDTYATTISPQPIRGDLQEESLLYETDGESDEPSQPIFSNTTCKCILTRCDCPNISPYTQVKTILPFIINGDIYIRFDFGQKFPPAVNTSINDFETLSIGSLATAKGKYDSYVLSDASFKIHDIVVDGQFIHTIITTQNMKDFHFAYSMADHFCDDNKCTSQTTKNFQITWELAQRRKREISRLRRSWFFGLENQEEVDDKVNDALRISQGLYNENKNDMLNLDKLIRQTDSTVAQQTETLNDIYTKICDLKIQTDSQTQILRIEESIMNNVKKMIQILRDCSMGNVPKAFSYDTLYNLCVKNINESVCDQLEHKIKTLIKCEIKSIHLLTTKYLINFELTIPKAFKTEYKLYSPITIPVFKGNYHHEIDNLADITIMKYEAKTEIVLLINCVDKEGMKICQATQSSDQKGHSCISDILENKPTQCWTESYQSKDTCFIKKFKNGLLISTKEPLQVHQHSSDHLFNSKSKLINGTAIIKNDPKNSYSVACNGILTSTDIISPDKISIHNHDNFQWDDAVQPIIDSKFKENFDKTTEITNETLFQLNHTVTDTHLNFDVKSILNPTGPHRHTWFIFLTMTGAFLGVCVVVALAFAAYKIYKKCNEPVVELAGYVGAATTRSQSFNYQKPTRYEMKPMSRARLL